MTNISPFLRTRFKDSWLPAEAELLLEMCKKHQAIRVFLPDQAEAIHSAILGFDLTASELLLDGFQSWPAHEAALLVEDASPIYLQITHAQGQYILKVLVTNISRRGGSYQALVNVMSSTTTANKRIVPRIIFPQQAGPKVNITALWQAGISGSLCDISQFGCCIKILGADARGKFQLPEADLAVSFNEQFKLETSCKILHRQFKRHPCCHNTVRLMFNKLEKLQTEQLKTFIHAFSESPLGISAA